MRTIGPPVAAPLRRLAAVLVGGILGAGAFAGLAAAGVVPAPDRPSRPPHEAGTLVERPGCAVAEPTGSPGDGTDQRVAVTVRPTALIGVDARGRVVDAWTNTGCAPRTTDDVYLRGADGTIRAGGRDLADRAWTGDFRRPGIAVAQPNGG